MKKFSLFLLLVLVSLVLAGCGEKQYSIWLSAEPGDGQVTLTWKPAEWVWVYQESGDGHFYRITPQDRLNTSTPCVVTGLINGKTYRFRVQPLVPGGYPKNEMSNTVEVIPGR